jgi:hypothetical protein
MTPQATTLTFEEEFPVSRAHAVRIDRAIARYPIVAEEVNFAPHEDLVLRLRKTWLGEFCWELPGVFRSMFWGVRIAVRMSGRKS